MVVVMKKTSGTWISSADEGVIVRLMKRRFGGEGDEGDDDYDADVVLVCWRIEKLGLVFDGLLGMGKGDCGMIVEVEGE